MRAADRVLRAIRQTRGLRRAAAWLAVQYIRFTVWSTRWTVEGDAAKNGLVARRIPFICAVWHGRLFVTPTLAPPGYRTIGMISNNRDGDLIAEIIAAWGVEAVRGSTFDHAKGRDKGGTQAFVGAKNALTGACCVTITPDGPRGPRMRAQPGVAQLCATTGCPVIGFGYACSRGFTFKNWDRFVLPLPFGRGALHWTAEIPVPAGADDPIEAHRLAIEEALIRVTQSADRAVGRRPVEPAAPRGSAAPGSA